MYRRPSRTRPNTPGIPLQIEPLENRSVPAASFAPDQVLVRFQPGVDEAGVAAALATVGGRLAERLSVGNASGELDLIALPGWLAVGDAVNRLQADPRVVYAEPNYALADQSFAAPTDPLYSGGALWGMQGPTTTPSNTYGSQAAAAWATGEVGSQAVYVGVIDEGLDYRHPDLYLNGWINRGEVPQFVAVAAGRTAWTATATVGPTTFRGGTSTATTASPTTARPATSTGRMWPGRSGRSGTTGLAWPG
jgi:hypothetical protein